MGFDVVVGLCGLGFVDGVFERLLGFVIRMPIGGCGCCLGVLFEGLFFVIGELGDFGAISGLG